MTRRVLNLSTRSWQFGRSTRQPFAAQPADDRSAVAEWLPAAVPGDVRGDLIAAGRIPPVETPEGIAAGAWVDDCNWWYRVALPGGLAPDEVAVLEADGVDYHSAIWLDDHRLATHAGMFSRQAIVLSPGLNAPGTHELAVRVWGGAALPRLPNPPWRRALRWLVGKLSPGTGYFPDRMATPKAQFSFGWDFAPRLLSTGIWDEIRLVIARGAYIEDLWVQAEPLAEEWRSGGAEVTPARFRVRVQGRRRFTAPMRAEIIIEPGDLRYTLNLHLSLNLHLNLDLNLELPAARLWWPWDQGEPNLYRVTVRLLDDAGVLDEASQVVGVRSVARTAFPDGGKWRWLVNGRPVFLRGANWAPADVLPGRVAEADYARLLGPARDAGINFLRVWGGGVREKRAFWDLCDRLGIMAWQEFPLACAFLDHYPRTQAYLDTLAAEARGIAVMLRNHPSLIAWCGGNELNPARERLPLRTLADVLAAEDPARPWIPASPCDGDVHQWQVWHGLAPWTDYAETEAPFMSEFGLQALPDAATVAEMFPAGAPSSLADPRWEARLAQVAKLRHYAGPDADRSIASASGLQRAIAATQRSQAAALQAGIEACRLRRESAPSLPGESACPEQTQGGVGEARCGGLAFWQLNEPWPAVSWSVIDRAGRRKAAYETIARCCQPILIAARFPRRRYRASDAFRAEIWLVNDGPETRHTCRAEARLDGEIIWSAEDVEIPSASATRIGAINLTLVTIPQTLSLHLRSDQALLATNQYDLDVHLPGSQLWRARLVHAVADRLLETD